MICCNDAMSATTPFFGSNTRRAARADRERVQRLDAVFETIVDRQEALLVRLLRGCAQAVVDAPLAQKLALREDFAWMELDAMKQCSALFDVRRPRPRSRAGRIIPERLSALQAASSKRQEEAKREQNDDECLEADERRWRVAKAADDTAAVDVTVAPPPPLPLAAAPLAPPAGAPPAPARRTSKRVAEAKQADAAAPASAAARLDAVNATLEACRASRAVVAAKREDKKRLRAERAERKRAANAARCQCPSTCVLGGMVPSCRRL